MKAFIDNYKSVVVQMATPFSVGTGFYLKEYNLLVTNEHVVRQNKMVVVDAEGMSRSLLDVVYLDAKYDLAFVKAPVEHHMGDAQIRKQLVATEGDTVMAVGHPFGLKFTATQGIISNVAHHQGDIQYIQHDAALNPGNSGGPLIDGQGYIIGVNTFIIQNGQNIGFSLPSNYLAQALDEFVRGGGKSGVRCTSCANIVFEPNPEKKYCPHCGADILMICDLEDYTPSGFRREIEDVLSTLHYDVRLTRRGPFNWEAVVGSAKVILSYHEETGMIAGDAVLSSLPKDNIKAIYTYLLQQNDKLKGLSLSIRNNDILLSMVMFDNYFTPESGKNTIQNLLETANQLDDVLLEQYGAMKRPD